MENKQKNQVASWGILYIVGTPIGNLEDITLRALRILKEVDFIAVEDTRTARKLLGRYEIRTPVTSYYDAEERKKSCRILSRLKSGEMVALISEAGMPGVSDPGYRLVTKAIDAGIPVVPIPGPSAFLSALVASGLATDRFIFEGFLPRTSAGVKKKIIPLRNEDRTVVFYESPRRLPATLKIIWDILGERKIVVARELTKLYEEIIRGTAREVIERFSGREIKGEIVLLVEGRKENTGWDDISPDDQIKMLVDDFGISRMEAIKLVAELRGVSKSEIYRGYHQKR